METCVVTSLKTLLAHLLRKSNRSMFSEELNGPLSRPEPPSPPSSSEASSISTCCCCPGDFRLTRRTNCETVWWRRTCRKRAEVGTSARLRHSNNHSNGKKWRVGVGNLWRKNNKPTEKNEHVVGDDDGEEMNRELCITASTTTTAATTTSCTAGGGGDYHCTQRSGGGCVGGYGTKERTRTPAVSLSSCYYLLILLALLGMCQVSEECPSVCECKWKSGKESVICANAKTKLTEIPSGLDPGTQVSAKIYIPTSMSTRVHTNVYGAIV